MATQLQIKANRANAQHSTGPRTPDGKARSSGNSLKHGLTGRFRVLDTEDQDAFDQLLDAHLEDLAPTTQYELFLVEQIAKAQWLVARAHRIEAALIEQMTESRECENNDELLCNSYRFDSSPAVMKVQRQAAAHQRVAFRAMDQLRALRRDQTRDARQNEPNSRVSPLPPSTSRLSPLPPLPPSSPVPPSTSPYLPLSPLPPSS